MIFHRSHLITNCLLILIPYAAASITFNLPKIGPDNHSIIVTEGEASISDSGIHVTPEVLGSNRSQKAGRATYITPFHLWDNRSNELANFATNFTFVINSDWWEQDAYGLAFFMAQNNSVICLDGAMGLPVNATIPFVAVEFDTYIDSWDPGDYDHVGININNLNSVASNIWSTQSRKDCEVRITYDSVLKKLSVSLFYMRIDNSVDSQIEFAHGIDLSKVLPEWVIFGFSAATSGEKVENNNRFQAYNVKSWSFSGSVLQDDKNNRLPPSLNPIPNLKPKTREAPVLHEGQANDNNNRVGKLVGLLVGGVAFVAVVSFCLWRIKNRKSRKDEAEDELGFDIEMNNEFEMSTGPKRFYYRELAQSTGEFLEDEKLGEGGFGGVYKGFLKDSSTYIAVKRVSKTSKQGIKEYASEVKIISRLRHRNLVQLIGWCHEKGELLLVYEFMENGSLDSHLFEAKTFLTWGTRYKIAQGLASALLYLHEDWQQCVLHRDIKSSNVMLDSNFDAKLGDFGLAKLVDHEKGSQTTMLAGTLGYMAPECVVTGKATKESDAFSFGVVALEIACGRKPIKYMAPEMQIRLVQWVWELYGTRTLLEAVDPRLGLDFEEEEIKRLMILGLWCVHPDPDFRPSMRQVGQVLNSEASLPTLPSKMPVASYLTPPLSPLHGVTSIVQNQSSSSVFNTDSLKQTSSTDQDLRSPSCSTSVFHSTGRSKDSEFPIMPCQSDL